LDGLALTEDRDGSRYCPRRVFQPFLAAATYEACERFLPFDPALLLEPAFDRDPALLLEPAFDRDPALLLEPAFDFADLAGFFFFAVAMERSLLGG